MGLIIILLIVGAFLLISSIKNLIARKEIAAYTSMGFSLIVIVVTLLMLPLL
ncbi:hypothetical protein [Bacillus sp. SM2101]|uniref:hypothetical protein n=1 Tax=Bacillus sp. SM2101 TaxID=2805366 RepID=UPI001BDDF9FD|nr:hypothetical protein [Bacillus sp. SM2101]